MLSPEVQSFRLACSIPVPEDATSFVRAMGPLSQMSFRDRRLELVAPRNVGGNGHLTWDWLAGCDALFLQRPYHRTELLCAIEARMMGVPVWIDWDDDNCAVPPGHPHYKRLAKENTPDVISELIDLADFVSVSTTELRRVRSAGLTNADRILVIPNPCQWPFVDSARSKVITWRGASYHDKDIESVLSAFREVSFLGECAAWTWHFLGSVPNNLNRAFPSGRLVTTKPQSIYQYMNTFLQLNPWVHVVPLVDNPFNRSKSNLAWIEATAAGAIVLAPNWEEWQRPGILNYSDESDFKAKLLSLIAEFPPGSATAPIGNRVLKSREVIAANHDPEVLNRARWEILNSLWRRRHSA